MWARVSMFKGPSERVDEDILESRRLAREVSSIPGSRGLYYFVDRESGEAMAVTLWDGEQALRASEEAADRIRKEGARNVDAEIVDVKRFEVVIEPADLQGETEARRMAS